MENKKLQSVGVFIVNRTLRGAWMSERIGCREFNGCIATPGGVRESSDADLLDTVIRETREECGIELDVNRIFAIHQGEFVAPSRGPYEAHHFIAFSDEVPVNKEPEKHGDWVMMPWTFLIARASLMESTRAALMRIRFMTEVGYAMATMQDAMRIVSEDYDTTGCESCGVVSESAIQVLRKQLSHDRC